MSILRRLAVACRAGALLRRVWCFCAETVAAQRLGGLYIYKGSVIVEFPPGFHVVQVVRNRCDDDGVPVEQKYM